LLSGDSRPRLNAAGRDHPGQQPGNSTDWVAVTELTRRDGWGCAGVV